MIKGACLLAVLMLSTLASAQETSPRAKWWDAPGMQASLHLTREQVSKIDAVFESTLPQRLALRRQLDALESEEQTLLSQATLDDDAAMRVIERVEAVRARRNTARALLLYRIRQLLTPDQRRWFDHRASSDRTQSSSGGAPSKGVQ